MEKEDWDELKAKHWNKDEHNIKLNSGKQIVSNWHNPARITLSNDLSIILGIFDDDLTAGVHWGSYPNTRNPKVVGPIVLGKNRSIQLIRGIRMGLTEHICSYENNECKDCNEIKSFDLAIDLLNKS